MNKEVNVFHDAIGNTLVVWFGDRDQEVEVKETEEDIVLMKDKSGQVIGFEKLNFLAPDELTQDKEPIRIAFETIAASAI